MLGGHCAACLVRTSLVSGDAELQPDAPLIFLRSFGDYELLDEIARGGMGVVYRARQRSLNRLVAVKMLLAGEFASAEFVRRFRREAEAAAGLRHPHIVAIYEVGQKDGQHFFSMELIEGRNLTDLVRERPLPAHRAAAYLRTIAEAVGFAHDHGILHRDLKPSNILVDPFDQPRITDFGLAKQLEGAGFGETPGGREQATLTGQAMGSPAFMAPEQAAGRSTVGPAADLYSLGAVLYHLITGRPPFQGGSIAATLRQLQEEEPVPPRRLNPSIPDDLQTIGLKCLEKDPKRRYASAHELAEELGRFLRGDPIRARPVSQVRKLSLWCRRRPALAALSASVLLLLAVVAVGSSAAAWRISIARRTEQGEREKAQSASLRLQAANVRLAETISQLERQRADDLFRANQPAAGVAHLAALLRRDASNGIAANRLVSALLDRDWIRPVAPPMRHEENVRSVSFAPDGLQVLSVSDENHACVRSVPGGELRFRLSHQGRVLVAHYSRDGRLMATGSEEGAARIWDARDGRPVTAFLKHAGEVRWVEFSPDGRHLVTVSADRTVRVWSTVDDAAKATWDNPDSGVLRAHFSPDGQRIATIGETGSIRLYHSDSGEFLFELSDHRTRVNAVSFSPDGTRLVAAGSQGTAWVWNLSDRPGRPIGLIHSWDIFPIWHATFSPDGQYVLTTSEDTTARVWNSSNGFPVGQPLSHEGGVVFGEFSPDGHRVVTTSSDTSARVWDWRSGRPLFQPLRHLKPVRFAAFSADGRRLQTVASDSTSQLWDLDWHRAMPTEFRHTQPVTAVAFRPDGARLLTTSLDRTACVWRTHDGQPAGASMRHEAEVFHGDLSPDGRLAATACADGAAYVWELATSRVVSGPVWHSNAVGSVRFNAASDRFVTASSDGTARVWATGSGQAVTPPLIHAGEVRGAGFSRDGRWVASVSEDWTARVWNSQTGQPLTEPLRHRDHVKWADFSPDGTKLVTASTDDTACIWDLRTSRPAAPLLQHARIIEMALFSPDGRRVVTVSQDRTARVWDAGTGQALTPSMPHLGAVSHVAVSPDGRRLLTGGWNGLVRLWDSSTGEPLTEWLYAGGKLRSLGFDPTGDRIATGSDAGIADVWSLPVAPLPVPDWFPGFAEAVAGARLSPRGHEERVYYDEMNVLAGERLKQGGDDLYSKVARWILANPGERPPSPF
jgi:WD40 repeat protein/serine/threonine protein kinase